MLIKKHSLNYHHSSNVVICNRKYLAKAISAEYKHPKFLSSKLKGKFFLLNFSNTWNALSDFRKLLLPSCIA